MINSLEKKLFVFDVDGTILTDKKKVLQSTKIALKELKNNGHYLAIATGRTPFQAFKIAKKLSMDYIIGTNGTSIYNVNKKEYLNFYIDKIPIKAILYIVKIAQENSREFFISDGKKNWRTYFGINPKKEIKDNSFFLNGSNRKYKYLKWDKIKKQINTKKIIQANVKMEPMLVKKYFSKTCDELRNLVSVCESSKILIEINPLNQSKFSGIEKIQKILLVNNNNTYCFGDSNNDQEMIMKCGNGIAMFNANENLKKVAKYITDSNNSDGIFNFLKKWELI